MTETEKRKYFEFLKKELEVKNKYIFIIMLKN